MTGKVRKKGSEEILIGVTVTNLNLNAYNTSDLGGNYKIEARPGDSLVFSSAGYLPDTIFVNLSSITNNYIVFLSPKILALPFIQVNEASSYQMDSIERRNEYAFILNKKHPVKLWNEKRAGDQPGFNFSPIGYFSTNEKQKRKLKRRLLQEEKDYYIDYRFSPTRVSQLTGLKGDSLRIFMQRYRPGYKFCRKANNEDLLFYINDKLKLFKHRQATQQLLHDPIDYKLYH